MLEIIIALILGGLVGSFLNVVAHRLPVMMKREWVAECAEIDGAKVEYADEYPERFNIAVPASRCPKCNSQIKPWFNIPVFGWLMLRGKCNDCSAPISARYPIVEGVTAILSAATVWQFGATLEGLFWLGFVWSLVALTLIDLDEMILPDKITLPLVWAGILWHLWSQTLPLETVIIGAMAGYLSLWSVYWLFKLITGKEGMGYGDFKLFAAFGAWFGWEALPLIILLSAAAGAVIGLIQQRIRAGQPMAFGPYLCVAAIVYLFFGEQIMAWYLGSMF
ncbi:prepilin peptidase [Salinibius halmophilus]|uniref:prepilin peptidase n=1 Tax=Salinibius halmophilus TaxID=1853216 RepID=UPI000E672D16|nr:A24 family peptidase [Salinibius halmophilus]